VNQPLRADRRDTSGEHESLHYRASGCARSRFRADPWPGSGICHRWCLFLPEMDITDRC